MRTIELSGSTLSPEELYQLRDDTVQIKLSNDALNKIDDSRQIVDHLSQEDRPTYGINTGFGQFATVRIPSDKLDQLQQNLIRSHAAGIGKPLNWQQVRMLLALRINTLAKGYSGISRHTVLALVEACNRCCLSYVPEQGTVGASGDLAPLSHLALGLMGQGLMWDPTEKVFFPAHEVLRKYQLSPIQLSSKEGLSLINGTQFMTMFAVEALVRAELLVKQAIYIAALSVEALMGTHLAFDERIHATRPHHGQVECARMLRSVLHSDKYPSKIYESHQDCGRVQDAYSLRCIPQVYGVTMDTMAFVKHIITTEINSATDNPMVFAKDHAILSGGNFHGEYVSKMLDYLTIAVHEIGSMSERRMDRLMSSHFSYHLPAFLVRDGGLHSGFMLAHVTAAALVSENKVLCHPASVDSITTSAGKEDHVSMGGFAARKCLQVVQNVERIVAIEWMCASQGIDLRRPLTTTLPLEALYGCLREAIPMWEEDRYMAADIEKVTEKLIRGDGLRCVEKFLQ